MWFFPDTFILLLTSPLKCHPSLFLSFLFSFCLLRSTSFPGLCCFTSPPSSPSTCCSCSVVSSGMISSVVWCKEGLKQQLRLAAGAWAASQPQGIAPRVPFGTNFFVFQKKPTGDSSQVWWWWWWGSGQCKWPALFLIPKAWRNGATQKLPLNH